MTVPNWDVKHDSIFKLEVPVERKMLTVPCVTPLPPFLPIVSVKSVAIWWADVVKEDMVPERPPTVLLFWFCLFHWVLF